MKQNITMIVDGSLIEAITPIRLINAISKAVIYEVADDAKVKEWIEYDNYSKVIDEVCELLEKKLDCKTWSKLKI